MFTQTQALDLGYSLFDKYNLDGWRLEVSDRPKRRLGCCKYRTKTIQLSRWVFDKCPEFMEDTVRHEVAHAIVGPGHGHKSFWKIKAIEVGAIPKACKAVPQAQRAEYKWMCTCTKCGQITSKNYRRRSNSTLLNRTSRCCRANIIQQPYNEIQAV